jgi:signal transduction histidine kinase
MNTLLHEISLAVRFARLNEMAHLDQQREVAERQTEFLRNVMHEATKSARTTNSIMPKLQAMLSDRPDALELIRTAHDQAERAMELLPLLFDSVAKPEEEPAGDVILCLHHEMERMATRYRGIHVVSEVRTESFETSGTPDVIALVLANVFDNAVEAMAKSGTLTVTEHDVRDVKTLVIDVTDTGHGISADNYDKIWEPYFSDDGNGRKKGVGLGLALIRKHMEKMHGSIDVNWSRPGVGTTFRLTFMARVEA